MTEAARDREFLDASILDAFVPEDADETIETIASSFLAREGIKVPRRSTLFFGTRSRFWYCNLILSYLFQGV